MEARFSAAGAAQLRADCDALCTVLRRYTPRPENFFKVRQTHEPATPKSQTHREQAMFGQTLSATVIAFPSTPTGVKEGVSELHRSPRALYQRTSEGPSVQPVAEVHLGTSC